MAHLIAVFLPETDDGSLAAPSSRSPMAEVGAGFGTAEVMGRVVGGLHRRRSLGFCRRPLFFWSAAWSLCPGQLRQGPLTACPLCPMTPMVEYSRLTGYFGILGSRPPSQIRFLASFGEDTQGSQIRFLASFVGHFAGKSQAKLATDRIWDDRWCCATSAFRGPGRSARSSQLALALAIASPESNAIARP